MGRWWIGLVGRWALLAAVPAMAQEGSEGAEAFVRSVFAGYESEKDDAWPLAEARLDRVWSSRMAGLIRRDRALATDDPPYLDADPLCQCQDWGQFRVESVRIGRDPGAGRTATVRFSNLGERATTVVRLSGDPITGWRIDDVLQSNGHGLAEQLARTNRQRAAGLPGLHRD
ncbi:MAG: DUF3828 domain-containing protein [Brevundimonas sp.]